jgi:membrane protease YdiL (CAAX protease family)
MMLLKKLAPLLPYVAVLIGLYLFHSAWIVLIIYHGGIILLLQKEKQWKTVQQLFKGWITRWGLLLIVLGLLAGVSFQILWPILGLQETLSKNMIAFHLEGWSFFLWTAYFFLMNPFFEEAFWRGYLGNNASNVVANDFWFAGYHVLVLLFFIPALWCLIAFFCLAATAWLWRRIVTKSGGLLMPTLSHLAADVSVMAVAGVHLFG